MKVLQRCLLLFFFCLLPLGSPKALSAVSPERPVMQEVTAQLQEHNRKLSWDLRMVRREIAALRADLNQPGIKEVFAGVGYIFGLFGVAAFAASRRRR